MLPNAAPGEKYIRPNLRDMARHMIRRESAAGQEPVFHCHAHVKKTPINGVFLRFLFINFLKI